MSTVSEFREGEITALDSFTALQGACGDSVNNAISVAPKVAAIKQIRVSHGQDGSTAGVGTYAVKLTGTGLDIQQSFSVGGWSNVGTETGAALDNAVTLIECNIPVNQNGTISVFGGVAGSADPGTVSMGVELVFQ